MEVHATTRVHSSVWHRFADPARLCTNRGARSVISAIASLELESMKSRRDVESVLRERIPHAPTRQFVLQNLVVDESNRVRWRVNLPAIAESVNEAAEPFGWDALPSTPDSLPSLFVGGGQSDYLTEAHHPVIRSKFPTAQFAVVPDAGHWVHSERPEQFARAVGQFLDQHDL